MAEVLTYDKRIFADNLLRLMKAQRKSRWTLPGCWA